MLFKVKYFIAVVAPKFEQQAIELMRGRNAHGISIMSGEGSARSEVLELLGLEDNKKEVITGFVPEQTELALMKDMDGLLEAHGAGIIFTINIDGFIGLKSMFIGNLE